MTSYSIVLSHGLLYIKQKTENNKIKKPVQASGDPRSTKVEPQAEYEEDSEVLLI